MPRYNIALLPEDEKLRDALIGYSRTHFRNDQDGYILGDRGRPHVTLCQFDADDDEQARRLFQTLKNKGSLQLQFDGFFANSHEGRVWTGLQIKKTHELEDMQKKVYAHLLTSQKKIHTAVDSYWPHLTFSRLKEGAAPPEMPEDKDFSNTTAASYYPALGTCSENGVFMQALQEHRPLIGNPAATLPPVLRKW